MVFVLVCCGMLWYAVVCCGMLQYAVVFCGMLWYAVVCAGMCFKVSSLKLTRFWFFGRNFSTVPRKSKFLAFPECLLMY